MSILCWSKKFSLAGQSVLWLRSHHCCEGLTSLKTMIEIQVKRSG